MLEDPWTAPPEEPYQLTGDPDAAPPPAEIVLSFEQGLPVALDGEELPLFALVGKLNETAGPYGIGRIDMIENRAVGIKSREVYEAPAAMVLIDAHRALEDLILTKAELQLKRQLETRWTEVVYDGLWFSPVREAIDVFVDHTQQLVSGEVRVELRAGRRRRERPPLGECALRRDARLVRAPGRRFPMRRQKVSSGSHRSRRSSRLPARASGLRPRREAGRMRSGPYTRLARGQVLHSNIRSRDRLGLCAFARLDPVLVR